MEAISILGREVMNPRGLIGLGYDTIDYCGAELAIVCPHLPFPTPQSNMSQALREFASSPRYPILVHCTQGKDRTGLIICLLLLLLDVPVDAVTYDYTLSEAGLLPEREEKMVEIREIGLTEEFASAPREWIVKMHEYLGEKYGGTREYLEAIGVDEGMQARITEVLLG